MISDVRDITSFKWATVTDTTPIEIQLDGDSTPLALIPDSLVDPLELSVGDRVRVELSLRKVVIHGKSQAGGSEASGEVRITARAAAPAGWLLCRGQSLLRTAYPRLFAAVGTTFGAADSTHFNVPNLQGRVVVGVNPADTQFDTIGETGGAKTHTLTAEQLPAHKHRLGSNYGGNLGYSEASSSTMYTVGWGQVRTSSNDLTSGTQDGTVGQAHNNLSPYIVLNYIIKI